MRAGVVQATWADRWGREVGLLRIFQHNILDIVYIQIFLLKIMGIQLNTLDT